jgi:hypothetical protein
MQTPLCAFAFVQRNGKMHSNSKDTKYHYIAPHRDIRLCSIDKHASLLAFYFLNNMLPIGDLVAEGKESWVWLRLYATEPVRLPREPMSEDTFRSDVALNYESVHLQPPSRVAAASRGTSTTHFMSTGEKHDEAAHMGKWSVRQSRGVSGGASNPVMLYTYAGAHVPSTSIMARAGWESSKPYFVEREEIEPTAQIGTPEFTAQLDWIDENICRGQLGKMWECCKSQTFWEKAVNDGRYTKDYLDNFKRRGGNSASQLFLTIFHLLMVLCFVVTLCI